MNNINYIDYDRVTDNLIYLSTNLSLNFTVVMSRKSKTGERVFCHYETEYGSKFNGVNTSRAIKRNMNYYYTIDNKNDFGNGFILRDSDVMMLIMIIEQKILPLFFDANKRVFGLVEDGERLVVNGVYEDIIYSQSEYKFLKFDPIVIQYEDGTYKEGIRMTVNASGEFADLDIDRFMGFYHLLKTTDMYSVASNMLTYAKTAPHGINVFRMQGLGGGVVRDNWNESMDIDSQMNAGSAKSNDFLNNAKTKRK